MNSRRARKIRREVKKQLRDSDFIHAFRAFVKQLTLRQRLKLALRVIRKQI